VLHHDELSETIDHLSHPGKGILAADESNHTIGKRFATIGVENTENNRRDYRLLLASTENLDQYISGVILFEETFQHKNPAGISVPELFSAKNILPGIKVDKGLIPLANTHGEQITQGLDGLEERLLHFKKQGAKFAKWRNVFSISEVLIDGHHSIEQAADASEVILHEVFNALFLHQVALECMILKPSMITSGKEHTPFSHPDEIAEYTLSVFRNHVPAAVPSINFLSGGQTPEQSIIHLNAINHFGEQPWMLSFSYGRALQEHCLQAWAGAEVNIPNAQAELLKAAEANSLAACGEYASNN
jgi:fructose-bisphosphate aldolase, class I